MEQVCEEGLKDAIRYLEEEDGEVVVFDATNTTIDRRKLLYDRIVKEKGFKLFFVESICDDESIIDSNIRSVKVSGLDLVICSHHLHELNLFFRSPAPTMSASVPIALLRTSKNAFSTMRSNTRL